MEGRWRARRLLESMGRRERSGLEGTRRTSTMVRFARLQGLERSLTFSDVSQRTQWIRSTLVLFKSSSACSRSSLVRPLSSLFANDG